MPPSERRRPDIGLRYGLTGGGVQHARDAGARRFPRPASLASTPWLDRANGYYAILGMEDRDNRRTHFGANLEKQLKPLIVEAMSHE